MKFLITGAGRGIGRGLTRILLREGHDVYLVDSNSSELENTLLLCPTWASTSPSSTSPSSSRFKGLQIDLSNRAQFPTLLSSVQSFFSDTLDVLINNAFSTPHTWSPPGTSLSSTTSSPSIESQWDLKIAVGLTAPFLLTRLFLPLLRKGQTADGNAGCIINISSTRAYMAEPDHEAYSAAKAGLLGLTRSLSVSLGGERGEGVRVNAIVPGWVDVDDENMEADGKGRRWGEELENADHRWHTTGRVGKVEDVAKAVRFLVDSGFVDGEEIVLDGGVTRKMVYPE